MPGDLIYTGTPGSTRKMTPGDVVEVEIEGIGVRCGTRLQLRLVRDQSLSALLPGGLGHSGGRTVSAQNRESSPQPAVSVA